MKITLIDSLAHIYRGFYALPPLTNSSGTPTNAIFAFAKTLLFVEKNFPATHGLVVFDKGKAVERLKIAPEYKATRPPMPAELLAQIPYTKQLAQAFGWKIAESENTEADDIISSISAKFANTEIQIVSNDKDLAQLVRDNVKMLITAKDGGLSTMDREGVFAKFAIYPEQVIDYLALVGDNSDNILGVPGVGSKTASKLLNEFFSLENILSNLSSIKSEKIRNSLAESIERLRRNKLLITLASNTFFSENIKIEDMKKNPPDISLVEKLCEELELKSILAEIKKSSSKESNQKTEPETYTPDLFQ